MSKRSANHTKSLTAMFLRGDYSGISAAGEARSTVTPPPSINIPPLKSKYLEHKRHINRIKWQLDNIFRPYNSTLSQFFTLWGVLIHINGMPDVGFTLESLDYKTAQDRQTDKNNLARGIRAGWIEVDEKHPDIYYITKKLYPVWEKMYAEWEKIEEEIYFKNIGA